MIARTVLIALALAVGAQAQLSGLLAPVATSNGLANQTSGNLERVVKRLQVESGRHILDSDGLLRELEKELTNRFGVTGELHLALIRPWTPVSMPAQDFELTVTDAPSAGLASTFAVKVKVVSAAEEIGEWSLPVRAQLLQEMWAASGRIERGQTLDRSQLAAQKVDVLRDRQPFIAADVDPTTLEVAQTITSPRLLNRRDVLDRPLVRKGQVVEVIAKQGLLAISMKALALESGPAGGLIRLRNLQSQKEFSAQILNESKVQVQF